MASFRYKENIRGGVSISAKSKIIYLERRFKDLHFVKKYGSLQKI